MALAGIKVVEFGGLAPGPFAGLILADNGASVTRIDKLSVPSTDILCRGKRFLAINPKTSSGLAVLKKLIASADVVIDPFRPGVLERLGLGPDVFLGDGKTKGLNERLIYGRIVGFPVTGPHRDMAGHDINYLALSGVLSMLPGTAEKPTFPLNLAADFAGGGLTLALGILLALISRHSTGKGQVVTTDMVSGTRYLASFPLIHAALASSGSPYFSSPRGSNLLDGGAPFYDVYTCSDGKWMSVACLEPAFYATFIDKFIPALPAGFSKWVPTRKSQADRAEWPKMRVFFENGFRTNTRDYWTAVFHGTDACTVPVLSTSEAGILDSHGATSTGIPVPHPQVKPHVSPTASGGLKNFSPAEGQNTMEILREMGLNDAEWDHLTVEKALGKDFEYPPSRSKL